MLADHVDVLPESRPQPVDGRKVTVGLDPGAEVLDQRLEARDVEASLAAEVLEDQAVGDAGRLGDLVDRDLVVVAVAEDLEGGGDQLEPTLTGPVGCQRARCD
ncbi:MAG TPA: hypothetical protein VIZ61_13820 [Solirubrobacterales bacterium]